MDIGVPAGIEMNAEFDRALALLESGRNVFITGEAGTGKSTLLRLYRDSLDPRPVVVAPTGVAALNVSGSTIHRLFSFPPTVSVQDVESGDYVPGRYRGLIKGLERLVVDEVSMVRADLMDAMEAALRRFGPRPGELFGGVQVIFFGDLYQLPPVVTDDEATFVREVYGSPHFMAARCLRGLPFDTVELQRVYRQRDERFLRVLNAVRSGVVSDEDLAVLNDRFIPGFQPPDGEFYVTLTTSNARADAINTQRLTALPDSEWRFEADSAGDVDLIADRVPQMLRVKPGAQVMMLNNDGGGRWVNGSMASVESVQVPDGEPVLTVRLTDSGRVEEVTQHTWEVQRPAYRDGHLTHDTVGWFTQFPVRLAWAVTIHKAQGQTLDRSIIDLHRGTFADGQLYVALSRCRTLEGTVLATQVKPHHVKVDPTVSWLMGRALLKSQAVDSTGTSTRYACLSVKRTATTGYIGQRSDRVFEVGCVLVENGSTVAEFDSLVNPERDIGASHSHGVTASMLSMAPTFAELWPWLSRRLAGTTLVANGMAETTAALQADARRAGLDIDLGVGICTEQLTAQPPNTRAVAHTSAGPSALDSARATAAALNGLELLGVPNRPVPRGQSPLADAARLEPRDPAAAAWDDLVRLLMLDSPDRDPAETYADAAPAILAAATDPDTAAAELRGFRRAANIDTVQARGVHRRIVDSAVAAARRDSRIDARERDYLLGLHRALDLPSPDLGDGDHTEVTLTPGMAVCFTGSATDLDGKPIDKDELGAMAEEIGLRPLPSVTKKNCHLLVAADAASMSGKAKKARQYGIPVIGVHDFLTLSQEHA